MKKKKKGSRRDWQRGKKFNNHHIKNRTNGGRTIQSNLIVMETERHKAFHFLFGNLSFREVAELLLRTCEIKGQQD